MTQKEATAEARRRWGRCARALTWEGMYMVYRRAAELVGRGSSWEEAFRDADRKPS